jgi:uncharacterized protein (DUF885 family)
MIRILVILAMGLGGVLFTVPMPTLANASDGDSSAQAEEVKKFRGFLDEDWKRAMVDQPEAATWLGFPGQNRRWNDNSPQGIELRKKHLRESISTLKTIRREELPDAEKLNYDLYRLILSEAEEGLQYGDDAGGGSLWMPLNQLQGIQQGAAEILALMPHETVADYEDILARLEALPPAVEQTLALLQDGLKRGYTPPKITLRDVPKQLADLTPDDPMASALLQPFTTFPLGVPDVEGARLIERAKSLYNGSVAPSFHKLDDYIVGTYIPACRESIAASALPNGAASYAFRIRVETTTNLTSQQIHEIGLAEVKRIHAEMEKVIASAGFKGSFHDFTQFLRTDARFFYDKPDDLVNAYRIIAKKIDPELAHLFGKLPRLPYGVCVIPDFKAPSQTTAYYQAGAPSAGRPGCYFVNTYKLDARPKWEMEALTLHESVPGHHLQISLAQELADVPEFRRHAGYTAFVEGWALYGESLGEELGMYKDPYSKFGRLSYEMWRAVRLVVDTGMHSMGWKRQQAIDYFRENTGKTDQDVTAEIDRYIVWPGQALAYKLGQLKIRELRTEAEKKLSAKFDARKFHDAVLENGAVPLSVLEVHMKQWMEEQGGH